MSRLSHSSERRFEFYDQQSAMVDKGATLLGRRDHWSAPVAIFDAKLGFDEEAWLSAMPETVLAYWIEGEPVVSRHRITEGNRSRLDARMALQARGSTNHYTCTGAVVFAQVYLSDALIDKGALELGVSPASRRLRDDLCFFPDPVLHDLVAQYITRSQCRTAPATRLEMEARALLLVDRVLTGHHAVPQILLRGGLAPWRERQSREYLVAHLASDISLDELAEVVGLSTFHFARAFRRSTGLTPHAYQRRLRCARAKELLSTTDRSIGQIAVEAGYETPQAFARMFRAEVGTSPSEYRRERKA